MKMKCHEIQNELFTYLENPLEHKQTKEIFAHLEKCEDCKNISLQLAKSISTIEKMKITENDPFFFDRVQQKMNSKTIQISHVTKFSFMRVAAIGLILLSTISAGVLVGYLSSNQLIATNKLTEEFNKQKDSEVTLYADNTFTLIEDSNSHE